MESSQLNDLSPEAQDKSEVPFGMLGSGSDDEYCFQTPAQKLSSRKGSQEYTAETFHGSESSEISSRGDSEIMSSSSSSSDAESGTYLHVKKSSLQPADGREVLKPKVIESEIDAFAVKENLHMAGEEGREGSLKEKEMLHQELLDKVANYEIELDLTKKNLQVSQEEVARLEFENLTLVEELGETMEKLRASEDNMKAMELKLRNEFQKGRDELQGKLELANQSVNLLQTELASERRLGSELQEMVLKSSNDLSDYSREVEELKLGLHDAQKDFSKDKSLFQSDIARLHEQNDGLQERLKETEMRFKTLEEQIQLYQVEKMEIEKSHKAGEASLLDEIRQLNMHLSEKDELADSLNKCLDSSKLNYDLLMTEKDEMFAKLQTLESELNCRDITVRQMEERISILTAEYKELAAEFEKIQKLAEDLRLKVTHQENELEEQKALIGDRAEEKREAIRQLCYSLEYYRKEYLELCQVFMKQKQPVTLAAQGRNLLS